MTQPANSAQPDTISVNAISAFSDNYIWLISCHDSKQHWLVDPGDGAAVLDYFQRQSLNSLAGILITHHHTDHIGGITALRDHFPHAKVFGVASQRVPQITDPVTPEQSLQLCPGLDMQVIDVPGHTRDHIAFYRHHDHQPLLFCGDTLFAGGCGRLFEGSPGEMRASLDKLRQLPPSTLVYCAHEYTLANLQFARAVEPENPFIERRIAEIQARRANQLPSVPSQLAEEIESNPFMRWDRPPVVAAAVHRGADGSNRDDVFAKIRAWKDNF